MEAAKCFKCIPRKSQREVLIYLFCQLANSEGGCVIPATPGGLSIAVGYGQNVLTWTAVADATSYNIKRALVTGGPYTTIDTDLASPYKDTAVVPGTDYFYVISAVNACGESGNSIEVQGAPYGDFQWTPVAQNVDWNDPGGHTGNLANFNATANKLATTLIQFDGHAVQTISFFGEGNLPVLVTFTTTGCGSLTSINSPDLSSITTATINNCPSLASIQFSGLVSIGGSINLSNATSLATINLSSVTSITSSLTFTGCTSLVSVNASSLVTIGNNLFGYNSTSLTSILCGSWIPTNGKTYDLHNCALDATTCNLILRRLVLAGVSTNVVDLSGGTNAGFAAWSAQGKADHNTLDAAGVTLIHNA